MINLRELKEKYPAEWTHAGEENIAFVETLARAGYVTWDDATAFRAAAEAAQKALSPADYADVISRIETLTQLQEETFVRQTLDEDTRHKVGESLFDKIAPYFDAMWSRFWKGASDFVLKVTKPFRDNATQIRRTTASILFRESYFSDVQLKWLPQNVKSRLGDFKNDPTITNALILALYSIAFDIGLLSGYILAVGKEASHRANKEIAPELPDIGTLLSVYQRYDQDRKVVLEKARELGYDDKEIELFLKAILPMHDPYNLRDMFLRGIISKDEHDLRLYQQGWDTKQIEQIRSLYPYIPNPPDLVRMAVREAWAEDYAQKWGSDKDYPKEFEQWAGKQGMSPYWSQRFWRAHWEIPSSMQGFEMLQRGVITRPELEQLLKAMDIMPGWREKLLQISFLPLTRVDVRRMYQVGVLTREEVFQSYKELGYDNKNAERMTEFTVRYTSEAERDLTKADILAVYQRGMVDYESTKALLVNMGYDPNEADVLIAKIDYDLAKKEKDTILKNIAKAYKKGILSATDVYSRTSQIGMERIETERLILQWDLETQDSYTAISRIDLDKLFKAKKIDETTYRQELTNMLYAQKHIEWLVELNKP